MTIQIDNKTARRLFLHRHGLCTNPAVACSRFDIQNMIEKIGFVQVDSIRTVERAHHLILFSRHQTFKHAMLDKLLEDDRSLFENWTHDASIIPSKFYPYWKHQFEQQKTVIAARWEKWGRKGFVKISKDVLTIMETNGPTLARELKPAKTNNKSKPGWWDWHPSKIALEYLWRTGETAISSRIGFQKAYDLAHRVIPPQHFNDSVTSKQFIDWACSSALERLGFATHSEIAAFWGLIKPAIAKSWVEENAADLLQIEVRSHNNTTSKPVWTKQRTLDEITDLADPPKRLRILSPFDPLLRDRKRALFLFGFDYRIEVFVPEAKRKYGYYVFPILQGDRLIGRVDMKADRKNSSLNVRRLWLEEKVKWSNARKSAFESELNRLMRFSGLNDLRIQPDAFST
ncbi:MAG: winged helix DNA-binding domain-containing protein [Rhizobiaceae bacterium]|nr:winged helix DNA-binding domain-containing protein [Rhizobiaceae bacterium]